MFNCWHIECIIERMLQSFRKYIKTELYPQNSPIIKFKTNFSNCVQEVMVSRQYQPTSGDDWDINWCEKDGITQALDKIRLHPNKKINHFSNYYELCRKDLLYKNVKRYKKALEKEGKAEAAQFDFMPLTYVLPSQYPLFLDEFKKSKEHKSAKALWIMKPIAKSQGKGIFLFKHISDIAEWSEMANKPEPYIVQRYLNHPLLIGHKKFDFRIYVLVTSYDPLKIYLYRSGFARFTHKRYTPHDIHNYQSHLTNVAIQKQSNNYNDENGGKYQLDKIRLYLISKFGEKAIYQCFATIQKLIIKTLVATSKVIVPDKRCFQLYGFDIMLDKWLKPWLIEVNGSPSMTANTPVDHTLKSMLLDDTLNIVNLQKLLQGDQQQIGGFDLIYNNRELILSEGSMLGCHNNRKEQLKHLFQGIALKRAQKVKEELKAKNKQSLKKQDNSPRGIITKRTRTFLTRTSSKFSENKDKEFLKRYQKKYEVRLPDVQSKTNLSANHPETSKKMRKKP